METGQKIIQQSNNIDHESPNILSIQVSLNGLSFCILNSHTNTFTYHKKVTFDKKLNPQQLEDELDTFFETDLRLQQSFSKATIIYANELFTLVPKALFSEDNLADYLKFNSRILQTDFISHDTVKSNESVIVYVPYANINNYVYDKFGEFVYKHSSTILLDTLLNQEKTTNSKKMFVNVNDGHFEILVVEGKKLILFNSFEYQTKEDFIYYILFTAEQLKLNPEEFPLSLLGDVKENDDIFTIVYKYIRHVSLLENDSSAKVALGFEDGIATNYILQHSF